MSRTAQLVQKANRLEWTEQSQPLFSKKIKKIFRKDLTNEKSYVII